MELLELIMPPVLAAIGAYGRKVLTAAEDGAADATVHLGQRLLRRLRPGKGVEEAVGDAAEHPGDADFRGALRARVRKAIEADPELARELAALVQAQGQGVSATGERSVAVRHNSGIISTGDGATNTISRG